MHIMCLLGLLSLLSVLSAPQHSCAPAKQSRGMVEYALMLCMAALVVISGITLLMPIVHQSISKVMPGL
jgi:hypothetical protein